MFELHPWHQEQWVKILQQRKAQRLPHALLFTGAKGVGKHQFARFVGASMLCGQSTPDGPCHQCRSCGLLDSGNHPDLIELSPEEPGKVIKVEPVRAVIDRLQGTAQQGGYRVLIIYPAEEMNVSSANALLKTLEEPGDNTLIILVADQLGQIMPTLRSRCQRINFPVPERTLAERWLSERLGVKREEAANLLALTQGAPILAYNWRTEEAMDLRAKLMSGLADIVRGRESPVALAEQLQKSDVELMLNWWSALISDIVRMQLSGVCEPQTNADMKRLAASVGQRAQTEQLFNFFDQIQTERRGLLKHQNPNKQLLLEKLLLSWRSMARAE